MRNKFLAILLISCITPVMAQGPPGCFTPSFDAEQNKHRAKVVQEVREHFGHDSVQLANALVNLADTQADFQPEKATASLQQALSIYEKHSGKNAANVADTLCKLAHSLQMSGAYEIAEPIWIRAAKSYNQDKIANNRGVSRALYGLSNGYLSGRHPAPEKAVTSLQQAVKLDQSSYGAGSAHVYNDLIMLATAYRMQNKSDMELAIVARADDLSKRLNLKIIGEGTAAHGNIQDLLRAEEN